MDSAVVVPFLPAAILTTLDNSANTFRDRYGALSDEKWRDLLIRSMRQSVIDDIPFPTFPEAEVQEHMHGHSGEVSLREAQGFYSFVKSLPGVGAVLQPGASFLDFGSGWGRHARMYLRDFDLSNMTGFEPSPGYCALARSLNPYIAFLNGGFTPDGTLPSDRFDLVVGFSVFSHLSPRSAGDWLEEMARVTRTGGYCVFTTWGDRLLDLLAGERDKLLQNPDADVHWYHKVCLRSAGDLAKQRARYAKGEFVWFDNYGSELYGDAFISPKALRALLRARRLPFELVEFDDQRLGQDAFTLERGAEYERVSVWATAKTPEPTTVPAFAALVPAESEIVAP